jgi:MFS family permease
LRFIETGSQRICSSDELLDRIFAVRRGSHVEKPLVDDSQFGTLSMSACTGPVDVGHHAATEAEVPQRSIRQNLRSMTVDGVLFSVMVGIGENSIPAFVLAAGLGEVASGLITTLPLLAGAVLQLLAPRGVKWLGSPRRWVVGSAALQAACFVPMALSALSGGISMFAVFFLVSCYWGFGMASGAAWGSWAETLVPSQVRSNYFARRTRFVQAGTLVGILAGGFGLQYARQGGLELTAFAVLFGIAAICRFASAGALGSQSETPPKKDEHKHVSTMELCRRVWNGGPERFLAYLVAMQFGVYLSGPYFSPYMLKHLEFSYSTYALLIGSCFLAKMVAMPFWGIVVQRSGAQRLLWIGGLGIIPISGLWMVSNSLPFLFALQIAGGFAWAAYELAMLLLFFETLRRDERTALMTQYQAANAISMVAGSLLGGFIINWFGQTSASYLMVFGLSSVFRFSTVGILLTLPVLKLQSLPSPLPVLAAERIPAPVVAVERRPVPTFVEDMRVRKPEPQSVLAN